MQIKATQSLKGQLEDSLAEFSSFDRVTVDINDLIRAVFKEFHAGGEYAKGKQREYNAWRLKHHSKLAHLRAATMESRLYEKCGKVVAIPRRASHHLRGSPTTRSMCSIQYSSNTMLTFGRSPVLRSLMALWSNSRSVQSKRVSFVTL
jgi:hypothetical protein